MKLLGMLAVAVSILAAAPVQGQSMVQPQDRGVDFTRWEGRWYEVARLPNWPQRHCGPEVVTTLLRRTNGDLSVVHQCRTTDGLWGPVWGVSLAYGQFEDPPTPGTLGARFTPEWVTLPPFVWGNYYALALDIDARYALLGTTNREHLWILSQTRTIDEGVYQKAVAKAAELGFDTAALIRVVK
jgi:apolipoprotein D and lipocalin family protein